MNSDDPGIICFQHCEPNKKVFTFKFPETCSLCQQSLANTELRIPPFRVPYPFRDASSAANMVVIKPTVGNFLNNYENSSDLHIGVTDSEGYVYAFDAGGKEKSNGKTWTQCLPVKIMEDITTSQRLYWDMILDAVFKETQWTADKYNPENYNCYNFVLSFLRSLDLRDLNPYLTNKNIFSEEVISCQTRIAAKYISLYRELKTHDIVVK